MGKESRGFQGRLECASEMGDCRNRDARFPELDVNAQGPCKSSTLCKWWDFLIPRAIPWAGASLHSWTPHWEIPSVDQEVQCDTV